MKPIKKFLTLTLATLFLSVIMTGCCEKEENHEKAEVSKTATVEELGQMNRDFAKASWKG